MTAPNPTDVLVIGAGMAGAAISARLSARGLRVVCLEQGGWVTPEQHPHELPDWEFEMWRGWGRNPALRAEPADYPVSAPGVDVMLMNAVSGSTLHYSAHWPRLKPVDFRKGTEHGLEGSADWPITYEDLAPYYAQNDAALGISGLAGDPANPPREARQTRPLAFGPLTRRVAAACDALGWHWWPADNAIISADYDGRPACNNCAGCRSGCPRGSLSTAAVWWPTALANGAELRTGARVERITTDARGRADGAVYINLVSGARHRQRASVVVLCANGLGTPRLLLLSADARHPDGLANSSGLVGRYLMQHAWAGQTLIFPKAADSYAGAFGAPLLSEQFYETDPARGFVNGFLWQFHRGFPAAQSALATQWGSGHRAAFAERFGHDLWFWLQAEDLPVHANRVELDLTRHDSSGLPGVRVTWQLHPNDRRILEFGRARAAELARAASAELRPADPAAPNPGWHLLGTARMGADPGSSVVDAQHQAWDTPNLYICDGSSFVTCGAANPTSTIGALALRCADGIAARA